MNLQVGDLLKYEDENGVSICIVRNVYQKQSLEYFDVSWLITKGFADCKETQNGYETDGCLSHTWSKI
jgi:hypothetical protein